MNLVADAKGDIFLDTDHNAIRSNFLIAASQVKML
jgi:hypothetical protein